MTTTMASILTRTRRNAPTLLMVQMMTQPAVKAPKHPRPGKAPLFKSGNGRSEAVESHLEVSALCCRSVLPIFVILGACIAMLCGAPFS